ncbi:hypothetical protein GCM10010145_29490 [Streptomyces ruber]|uniref:eCIS core domain-containing protein n=2 Tax=Streptomyces TaxID=1883 RepID=A0A918BBN8_9ACTN|nr:DUF4157 domain-containing protein [Streptomyces ruber]GGQ57699.1 hypothetical protein GCM10010145_29490 [Streptomyces ruber]
MSGSRSTARQDRTDRSAEQRRRRRRERAARSRTAEPKDVVSGAGQPLDPGTRRELEEQLGHDLGRVRLHTDRDAGQLTRLLGADAVAVGQDIFFGEGAYVPGTAEGRRLLAHELLHTLQNPHGLGTLRAGRELGAVSLPQEGIEREAESAAREAVRPERESARQDALPVEEGQATPGWLRYATVDADRLRAEAVDPATLVDRLANSVLRSLRGDPEDLSKRTRRQLARLPGELLDGVLVRLDDKLLGSEYDRVLDLVDEAEAYDDHAAEGLERDTQDAPAIEPDTADDIRAERQNERQRAEEGRAEEKRPDLAPGPEKERPGEEGAPGSTPQNGGTPEHGTTPQGGAAPREPDQGSSAAAPAAPTEQTSSSPPASADKTDAGQRSGGERQSAAPAAGKEKGEDEGGQEATERQETPAAGKEESAARNRPGAAEAAVSGQQVRQEDKRGRQQPTGSPTVAGQDTRLPGAASTLEGRRSQDLEGMEEETEEDLLGSGSESEVEAGGGDPSAWDIKLQPEDFLPQRDLDVSGVPTADDLDPSSSATPPMPSVPAPPPTRAEEVQAQRDAEDAEDAAAEAEAEEETGDALAAEAESSAPETEGGPDGDGGLGGLVLERAAAALPVPGSAARDPKAGDDPKAGPVAAQTTVQEAPGGADGKSEGGSDVREPAAKEEKGTPAAGDRTSAAPEKESQQATGGRSAQSEAGTSGSAGADAGTSDTQDRAPAREAAGTTGGSSGSGAGASGASGTATTGGAQETGAEPSARPEPSVTATAPRPASAPSEPTAAPAPKTAPGAKDARETEPAPRSAAPSGGAARTGGGGGGAAAPAPGKGKKDSGPAPDLSGVSPEAGLASASKLKPHKALEAMGGVGGAVDRTVGDEHRTLASAPPGMERPAGAPRTLEGDPSTDAPAQYSQDPAQQAEEPDREDAEVTGEKEPEGQIEAEKAEEPSGWDTFKMALGFGIGWVAEKLGFEVDAQELAAKFAGLPTKDEALKQAQAGNAPGVEMQGAAGQKADEQDGHVDAKAQETVTTARDDSGRGMGEDQVYPNAPKEQLTARVPGRQGGGGEGAGAPGGGATGAVPPEAASEVAEHERGPQFQAAFTEGRKGISEGRQTKDRDFRGAQAEHRQQVDAEIAAGTDAQAGEREKAMAEVTAQREEWRTEQDAELKTLGDKKTDRHDKVRTDVEDQERETDDDVEKEKESSDKKIKDESDRAEKEAEQKKDGAVQESGNWITKAFEWIKQKVIEIKNAIVRVIRAARDAVVGFIRNFKDTVERWINEARKNIVEAIRTFIRDLIEFAKAMVRAIIDLAKRVRNLIVSLVKAAIALVNRLAQMLKQAVTDLLNAIGRLLSSIIDTLKKALQAAVKAVVDAVKAVMQFAAGLLSALGDFMLIAVDFLADPGGWLGGAKNSAVDGAKNHLFREVKAAVKDWFQSKIEEILGVPRAILDKLIKGGITLEQIVKETWDAIVPQLPVIIGEIVITKVIAKLIPGAGWVMAVIDAIRTAIGALGEILRAMGAVLDWLKAVRRGGAGVLFAKAVAAGIVALLELAYEALLSGIGKYVAKVGRRFKDVAAKLGGRGKGDKPGGDKGGDGKPPTDPAKRPATDPKTQTATTLKPGQGKDGAPGKAGTQADAKKPAPVTSKDKNGRPQDKDGKPDTAPAPTAKPKPKTEPPAKPKPEPGAKPKGTDGRGQDDRRSTDGRDQGEPKVARDTTGGTPRSKDADGETPDSPKNQDTSKPRGDGRDSPAKPMHDKGGLRSKLDKDTPGKPIQKPDKGGADRPGSKPGGKGLDTSKARPERSGPGRPKSKPQKERRKKDEDSKDSKDARLTKIVARIRPKVRQMLNRGTGRRLHTAALGAMRAWYRLTGLDLSGGSAFQDIASLNPQRLVINGATFDSEPVLRFIRKAERDIDTQRAQQLQGGASGVLQEQNDAKTTTSTVRPGTDMLTAGLLMEDELGEPGRHNIVNYQGPGGGEISSKKLGSSAARLYVEKRQDGKIQRESGTYDAALRRILEDGLIEESAQSLGTYQSGRATDFGADNSEMALLGHLAHNTEPARNAGTKVLSVLHQDFYRTIPGLTSRQEKVRAFIRAYMRQTMLPVGSAGAATLWHKHMKTPGSLDNAIAKQVALIQKNMRKNGTNPSLYEGDLRANPHWQLRTRSIREAEQQVQRAGGAVASRKKDLREAEKSSDRQRAADAQKALDEAKKAQTVARKKLSREKLQFRTREGTSYNSLRNLERLQDAEKLANREVALIQSWFNTNGAIDTESQGKAAETEMLLKKKIVERLQREFPWWQPSGDLLT